MTCPGMLPSLMGILGYHWYSAAVFIEPLSGTVRNEDGSVEAVVMVPLLTIYDVLTHVTTAWQSRIRLMSACYPLRPCALIQGALPVGVLGVLDLVPTYERRWHRFWCRPCGCMASSVKRCRLRTKETCIIEGNRQSGERHFVVWVDEHLSPLPVDSNAWTTLLSWNNNKTSDSEGNTSMLRAYRELCQRDQVYLCFQAPMSVTRVPRKQ